MIVVDGISVGDLDYVDIGRPLGAVEAVPVTVKTLDFLHRWMPDTPKEAADERRSRSRA